MLNQVQHDVLFGVIPYLIRDLILFLPLIPVLTHSAFSRKGRRNKKGCPGQTRVLGARVCWLVAADIMFNPLNHNPLFLNSTYMPLYLLNNV